MQPVFIKTIKEMAVTRLKRKARRNRTTARVRQENIQRLNSKPVIESVDVEKIKEEFKNKPAKKAEKKEEAPAKEEKKAEKKAETKKAEAKKEDKPKAEKKTAAKKKAAPKKDDKKEDK